MGAASSSPAVSPAAGRASKSHTFLEEVSAGGEKSASLKPPHLTTVADVEAKGHRDLEVSLDEIPDWEPKLAKAGCCGGARVVEEWCDDF